MTPADLTLARRAVACAGWRWLPGMLTCSMRIDGERDGRPVRYESGRDPDTGEPFRMECYPWPGFGEVCLPDLTDPSTLGCLLALVREALRDPEAFARRELCGPGWVVIRSNSVRLIRGDTEAAALVAALEAACQE